MDVLKIIGNQTVLIPSIFIIWAKNTMEVKGNRNLNLKHKIIFRFGFCVYLGSAVLVTDCLCPTEIIILQCLRFCHSTPPPVVMAPKDIMTNSHAKSILNAMNALRKSNTLCDITLRVEGTDFPAHRIVLAACSDYFCAMFTSEVTHTLYMHTHLSHVTQINVVLEQSVHRIMC